MENLIEAIKKIYHDRGLEVDTLTAQGYAQDIMGLAYAQLLQKLGARISTEQHANIQKLVATEQFDEIMSIIVHAYATKEEFEQDLQNVLTELLRDYSSHTTQKIA